MLHEVKPLPPPPSPSFFKFWYRNQYCMTPHLSVFIHSMMILWLPSRLLCSSLVSSCSSFLRVLNHTTPQRRISSRQLFYLTFSSLPLSSLTLLSRNSRLLRPLDTYSSWLHSSPWSSTLQLQYLLMCGKACCYYCWWLAALNNSLLLVTLLFCCTCLLVTLLFFCCCLLNYCCLFTLLFCFIVTVVSCHTTVVGC